MKSLTKLAITVLILFTIFSNNVVCKAEDNDSKEQIDEMIVSMCEEKNICPELVQSIVFYESSYKPNAKNNEHYGLMQINPKWHKSRMEKLGVEDLYNAEQNLKVGIDYLNELFLKYNDSVIVLNVYNSGKPIEKFTNYSRKILERSADLESEREEVYEDGTTVTFTFG